MCEARYGRENKAANEMTGFQGSGRAVGFIRGKDVVLIENVRPKLPQLSGLPRVRALEEGHPVLLFSLDEALKSGLPCLHGDPILGLKRPGAHPKPGFRNIRQRLEALAPVVA